MKSTIKTFKEDRNIFKKNIDTFEEWTKVLKVNPMIEIIKKGLPSEIFILIRDLLEYDHSHTLYRLAEKAVFKQSGLHRIFHKGLKKYEDVELNRHELFFNQLQRIHIIADFGATNYLNPVKEEIIKLLEFQNDDGRFPLYYQHNAHACLQLIKLGMEGNVMIDKCIKWVVKRQRDDGGWLHKNNTNSKSKAGSSKSCIWTTAEIALLLSKRSLFRNSNANKKACEFLLNNLLKENSSSTLLTSEDSWNQLYISSDTQYMFSGGTLKVLELLSLSGYNCSNKDYNRLYKWLLSQQLDSGFFPRTVSDLHIPDTLATIRALTVIKRTENKRD